MMSDRDKSLLSRLGVCPPKWVESPPPPVVEPERGIVCDRCGRLIRSGEWGTFSDEGIVHLRCPVPPEGA